MCDRRCYQCRFWTSWAAFYYDVGQSLDTGPCQHPSRPHGPNGACHEQARACKYFAPAVTPRRCCGTCDHSRPNPLVVVFGTCHTTTPPWAPSSPTLDLRRCGHDCQLWKEKP